ncbi:MAG: hypothetical protein V3V38_02555 [Nitrosopumilaceae archaeon]
MGVVSCGRIGDSGIAVSFSKAAFPPGTSEQSRSPHTMLLFAEP